MDRWIAWVEKASIIRQRYALNKEAILRALVHLRPRWYRSYNERQVLILLAVLHRLNNAELLLYKRFIQGSQVFLPEASSFQFEELYTALSHVQQLGTQLYREACNQQTVLQQLTSEFANAEQVDQVLQQTAITGILRYSQLLAESDILSRKIDVQSENIRVVHQRVLGDTEAKIILGIDAALQAVNLQLVSLENKFAGVMEYQKIAAVVSCCLFFAKYFADDSTQHITENIEVHVKRIKSTIRA